MADGHAFIEELEWEKIGPVGPYSVERLEYVLEQLEAADELAGDLTWQSEIADDVTVEELLGALGEAKHLLEYAEDLHKQTHDGPERR